MSFMAMNSKSAYALALKYILSSSQIEDGGFPTKLEPGFVKTAPRKSIHECTRDDDIFALDCEMVTTRVGKELARISVVDIHENVVLDVYVKPKNEILDYNTPRNIGMDSQKYTLSSLKQDIVDNNLHVKAIIQDILAFRGSLADLENLNEAGRAKISALRKFQSHFFDRDSFQSFPKPFESLFIYTDVIHCNVFKMSDFMDKNSKSAYALALLLSGSQIQDGGFPTKLESGFVMTAPRKSIHECGARDDIFALDCEMVTTRVGNELARISVVDIHENVVLDVYVKPKNEILDYNTPSSGITPEMMANATRDLASVQAELLRMFHSRTIIVGHGLVNDFLALKLIHDHIVDTSVIYHNELGAKSLKNLSKEKLGRTIQ
uniref:Exonuclease domain-containing protein n=1 Tax=Lutzomyia longipalpis TaxID=7200 RepID=A0A1B0CW84_LUTLO